MPFNETLNTVGSPPAERIFELQPMEYLRPPNGDMWVSLEPNPIAGGWVTYGSDRSMAVQLPYAAFPEDQWVQATTQDGDRLPLALRRVGLRMFGQWLE